MTPYNRRLVAAMYQSHENANAYLAQMQIQQPLRFNSVPYERTEYLAAAEGLVRWPAYYEALMPDGCNAWGYRPGHGVEGYDQGGGSSFLTPAPGTKGQGNAQGSDLSLHDSAIGHQANAKFHPNTVNYDDDEYIEDGVCNDIGCMLHDLGEDCMFCGNVSDRQKPEKYGGFRLWTKETVTEKEKEEESHRLDLISTSGSVFDSIAFGFPSLTNGWIAGLGTHEPSHPQTPQSSASEAATVPIAIPDLCGSCGTPASALKANGAGHCVECRYRWLEHFQARQAARAAKGRKWTADGVDVLAKTESR